MAECVENERKIRELCNLWEEPGAKTLLGRWDRRQEQCECGGGGIEGPGDGAAIQENFSRCLCCKPQEPWHWLWDSRAEQREGVIRLSP